MKINLNQLITTINSFYDDINLIQFEYSADDQLRISKGEVVCFVGIKDMEAVLHVNKVSPADGDLVYTTLSQYLINQLSASLGKKVFPEIESISSSFI